MRSALVKAFGLVPLGVKNWVYRRPWLAVPLSRALGRLVPSDRTLVVTVKGGPNKGAKLAIDRSVPRVFWLNEQLEREVFDAIRQHIRPGMTVADIGAYIGFDTLALSRWVGPGGRVLSFEPDPRTAQRLRQTCQLNDLQNVTIREQAVSDRSGRVRFSAQADVESHVVEPAGDEPDAEKGTIPVESVRLDDVVFAETNPRLDLAKVDAEDFETQVLLGSARVLGELAPVWVIEIHSPRSLNGCVRELRRFGYRITPIDVESYYRPAIEQILSGADAPELSFERGHILAVPATAEQS